MPRPKDWTVQVYRITEKPPDADPKLPRSKPVLDATLGFTVPRVLGVDAAKRVATAKLVEKKKKIRSMSFAAPIEERRIIAHVIGG